MTSQPPRRLVLLGLLALVPEAVYLLTQEEGLIPVLALACVLIIVASLVMMVSPADRKTAVPQ